MMASGSNDDKLVLVRVRANLPRSSRDGRMSSKICTIRTMIYNSDHFISVNYMSSGRV